MRFTPLYSAEYGGFLSRISVSSKDTNPLGFRLSHMSANCSAATLDENSAKIRYSTADASKHSSVATYLIFCAENSFDQIIEVTLWRLIQRLQIP